MCVNTESVRILSHNKKYIPGGVKAHTFGTLTVLGTLITMRPLRRTSSGITTHTLRKQLSRLCTRRPASLALAPRLPKGGLRS
jgi:hypothetical protein